MKQLKLTFAAAALSFIALGASAQTSLGLRIGGGFSNFTGKDVDSKMIPAFNVGLTADIPIAEDFYIQPGVLYSAKGAKAKGADAKVLPTYIEVPVNFVYKPELGDGNLLLGFGPYLGIGVGGKNKVGNVSADIKFGDGPGEMQRIDAGANFLAGYQFTNRLSAQLNAGLGLLNTAKDVKSKNVGFGLSLGYRLR